MLPLAVLADPIRLAIVRFLGGSGPSTVRELTSGTGVHRHTVRQHLAALRVAGVVEPAGEERRGRGRPRGRFRLRADGALPWADFRGLSEVLARALGALRPAPGVLRKVGRAWGRFFQGGRGGRRTQRDLPSVLEPLGFSAEVEGRDVRLSGCPCPLVLPENPALVCRLMIAVVDGFLEGGAPGSPRRVRRSCHDPRGRSCTLTL